MLNKFTIPDNFDIRYLICFIKYIQDKISVQNKKGILSKDIITYNYDLTIIPNYSEYNKELNLKSDEDMDLFKTIHNTIKNNDNIFDEINVLYRAYIDIQIDFSKINLFLNRGITEIKQIHDEDESGFKYKNINRKFTYFELFMIIFSYVFLEFNNNHYYDLTLSEELNKLSLNTKADKISIFFTVACIGINESQTSKEDRVKLGICQNKLSGVSDYNDLLKKIGNYANIYNMLLGNLNDMYTLLNEIVDNNYERNNYTINSEPHHISESEILWIICVIDILFYVNNVNSFIDNFISYIDDFKNGRINYSDMSKFYKLLFIVFYESNKNINSFITSEFGKLQKDIFKYYQSKSESESDKKTLKDSIYEHIEKVENPDRSLKQDYILLKNLLIFSINSIYINKILKIDQIKNIEDILILKNREKDDYIEFNYFIDKKYLIDKIKDEYPNDFQLYLSDIYFKHSSFSQKQILGNNTLNEEFDDTIYILKDDYTQILKNLFTLYFNL